MLDALIGFACAAIAFNLLMLARRRRARAERQAEGQRLENEDTFRTWWPGPGLRDLHAGPGGPAHLLEHRAERMTGYTEREALGRHFHLFRGGARRPGGPAAFLRASPKRGAWRMKAGGSARMAPGSWPTESSPLSGMPRPGARGFAKVTRDITA